MSNGYEYRVRWRRKGLRSREKIYQTLAGACAYCRTLRGEYPHADPDGWEDAGQRDPWEHVPPLEFGPVIERRTVGSWTTPPERQVP